MSEPFKIRPARLADREAMAALLKELGYADAADSSTVFWVLRHPEIDVFIAADAADRPIGMITLSHRPQLRLRGRITTIDELVVTESWRRKGVGLKLLNAAVARAKAMAAKRIELSTHLGRQLYPRAFYQRAGFAEVDNAALRLMELEKR